MFMLDELRRASGKDEWFRPWRDSRRMEVFRYFVDAKTCARLLDFISEDGSDNIYAMMRHMARPPFKNTYVEFENIEFPGVQYSYLDGHLTNKFGVMRIGNRCYVAAEQNGGPAVAHRASCDISHEGISCSSNDTDQKELSVALASMTEILWLLMARDRGSVVVHDIKSGGDPAGRPISRWVAHSTVTIDLSPRKFVSRIRKIFKTDLRAHKAEHDRAGNWCRFSWNRNCTHDWEVTLTGDDGFPIRKDCKICGSIFRWRKEHTCGKDSSRATFKDYRVKSK